MVWLISWLPERLFPVFQYSHFCCGSRADQVPPPTTTFVCLFVFLSVCLFLCFDDGYVNKSLDNSLPADITSQVYNNAHIYTHYTHTHIHTHTHTHTHWIMVFPAIYYSCSLMISSYHKSFQQYFDNLLNYKNLVKFAAVKK